MENNKQASPTLKIWDDLRLVWLDDTERESTEQVRRRLWHNWDTPGGKRIPFLLVTVWLCLLPYWPCGFELAVKHSLACFSLFLKWNYWASLVAQMVKSLPAVWKTWVPSLGQKDPLEKEMATQSSILAWEIPWTEEPGLVHGVSKSQTWLKWLSTWKELKELFLMDLSQSFKLCQGQERTHFFVSEIPHSI